jgi:Intein splicing domain/LAGLIDADG-like domain
MMKRKKSIKQSIDFQTRALEFTSPTQKPKRAKKAKAPVECSEPDVMPEIKEWYIFGLDPSLSGTGYALQHIRIDGDRTKARWVDVGTIKPADASDPIWIRSKNIAMFLRSRIPQVPSEEIAETGLILSFEQPTPGNDWLVGLNRIIHCEFFDGPGVPFEKDDRTILSNNFGAIRILHTNAATLRSLMGLTKTGNKNKAENIVKAYTFIDQEKFPNLDTDSCDGVLLAMMARHTASLLMGRPEEVPENVYISLTNATKEIKGKGTRARTITKGLLHRPEYWLASNYSADDEQAEEDSCQCLAVDNLVITPSGILYVDEVFQENSLEATSLPRAIAQEYPLINREGDVERTSQFTRNGRRPVFAVKTVSGNQIISTSSHPHLVMNRSGYWVWKRTDKIEPGDYLVTSRKYAVSIGQRAEVSDEELYFLGTLLADGSFTTYRVGVTNNDPVVKQHILEHGTAVLGVRPHQYAKVSAGSFDYHFNSKEAASALYAKKGWAPGVAKDKHLGPFIRRLSTEQVRLVLQGYFDCECSVQGSGIEVVSASWKLLFEVKSVLQSHFGIISLLKEKKVASYPDRQYWRLNLYGMSARLFVERIGFRSDVRNTQARVLPSDKMTNPNLDVVPGCGLLLEALYDSSETTREHNFETRDYKGAKPRASITYQSLETLLALPWAECAPLRRLKEIMTAGYYYDEVVGVEEREPEPTFDFVVPGSHSFHVANIITHNSTLSGADRPNGQ